MGRLTKDPEIRYGTTNNTAICNFTLAVDRRFKSEGQPTADFIPIVVFGKTAEFTSQYFSKGLKVGVIGRIQTRTWDDNDGQRHYVTEVLGEECYFCESKKDGISKDNNTTNTAPSYEIPDESDLPF